MARVTVEDCLKNVKNRFELVILAAKRARQLMHGKEPQVEWDNDKATVVALREIAAGHTNISSSSHEREEEMPVIIPAQPKIVQEEDDDEDEISDESSSHIDIDAEPSEPSTDEE